MLTVETLREPDGPPPRQGERLGQATTVDELHALLRDLVGEFRITGTTTVYIRRQRPLGGDRRYVERIALAANGHRMP